MRDLLYELQYLGFTNNEARVYLSLLRLGSCLAGKLAKECQIERTSTYNALQRLAKLGLVSYVIEKNKKVFSATDPSKIADSFKEKEERASLLAPKILKMKKGGNEGETILKFRGKSGIKNVLNDILQTCDKGEEYLMLGLDGKMSKRLETFSEIFVARKDAKKLRARALVKHMGNGQKMSKYTKVRYLPEDTHSHASFSIYGNKIAIIIWSENPETIIIDNKETADSFRSYFELMWENIKK